jgi:hypothetical protein
MGLGWFWALTRLVEPNLEHTLRTRGKLSRDATCKRGLAYEDPRVLRTECR